MKIGVAVLHYRFWPGVCTTLDALASQSKSPARTVVVDNHSEDGSVPKLRDRYPELEMIELGRNGGYAAGMNAGIEHLLNQQVDSILLLTHECLLAPPALERMALRLQEEPSIGAVGPLLGYLSRPETIWSAGGVIDRHAWRPTHLGTNETIVGWTGKTPYPVEWLDGACILLRAEAFRDAGPLDERYFLYFEEAEFLMRLAGRGWRVECVPGAIAWQEPAKIPGYLEVRNRVGFISATGPRRYLAREVVRVLHHWMRDALPGSATDDPRAAMVWYRGLRDFLIGAWGPPKQ